MPNQPADLDPVEDEELRVGSDRTPDHRLRWVALALVLLVGAVAVWLAVRGGDDGTPVAKTTPSAGLASATPTSLVSTALVELPATPEPFPGTSVPACPTAERCRVTSGVPAPVTRALRAAYPRARIASASTLTATGSVRATLLRRTIKAVAGSRRLDIVITPFVLGPDDFDRENSGRTSTVIVESTGSGESVQLLLTEPRTARPDNLTVLRLARDPRLNALG